MNRILKQITRLFQVDKDVPANLAENFQHYYWDITWYGLLNGTTIAFLNYFAVRVGATSTQVGLITAMPAIVSLVFALPAGVILARFPMNRATFVAAVLSRVFYFAFILLPFAQSSSFIIGAIIVITLVMTIPGVFANVGFNIAFAENVPDEYRAHVAGIRNAAFAVVTIGISLLSGAILSSIPFPYGYVAVFSIGVLGAAMSAYHLYRLKPVAENTRYDLQVPLQSEPTQGWFAARIAESAKAFKKQIRVDLIKGKTGFLILLLTLLYFSLYITGPVFPVYLVNRFHFSDQAISIGMACYNFTIFLGSLKLETIEIRLGRKKALGLGLLLMSTFPVLFIFMKSPMYYYGANLISGVGYALVGGEIYNYLFERIPAKDHASGIAWFSLSSNAALLVGSLLGPLLANSLGFVAAMSIFAFLRFAVSIAILRWG